MLCPFLHFFMQLVVVSWCQVLQFMWWTMLLIPIQDLLLFLLQEEIMSPVQIEGVQAYFDDAECRLSAAAEVAYLQIPSRNSCTETLAVEDLQLLAPKEGWRWAAAVSIMLLSRLGSGLTDSKTSHGIEGLNP